TPQTAPRVIRFACSDDIIRAIPTEAELREWPGQVEAAVAEQEQAGHVAAPWPGRVVTQHPERTTHVAAAARLPARHFCDLQAGAQQDIGQPGERVDHDQATPPMAAGSS